MGLSDRLEGSSALRPTACFIPAQGKRPGFMAPFWYRRPTACLIHTFQDELDNHRVEFDER